MLNTLHLQTFLAVVDAGNYSAAAERLHMSQPAVSQHIRALEKQLDGVRLFRRVGQQMLLTHAGEELVEMAREILGLSQRAEENIRALRGQLSGRVVVGCTASGVELLLPAIFRAFRERFPMVGVATVIAPMETLINWLGEQTVHVILLEEQHRRRGWETHLLSSERLALIAPRGHALLQQEQAPAGLLRRQPLILPRNGTPQRRMIEESLRRRGVAASDLDVALETDSAMLMLQSVRMGVGLAFVPDMLVTRVREVGVVDLAGVSLQQEWYAVRSRERGVQRAAQEWYQFVVSPEARALLIREGWKAPADA